MLKAIAIDDEPPALEVIGNLARQVPFIELAASFTRALAALEYLRKERVDLIFLDIRMPDIGGIDFVKTLANPPLVIFTTAHSEHAVQSFELDAVDYLLKPFSLPRFLKACNKADELLSLRAAAAAATLRTPGTSVAAGGSATSAPATIFIKNGYEQVKVRVNDILLVESMGNYVRFVVEGKEMVMSRLTMEQALALLPAGSFVRVSRSALVATSHITKIDKGSVWIGNREITVGQHFRAQVDKLIEGRG